MRFLASRPFPRRPLVGFLSMSPAALATNTPAGQPLSETGKVDAACNSAAVEKPSSLATASADLGLKRPSGDVAEPSKDEPAKKKPRTLMDFGVVQAKTAVAGKDQESTVTSPVLSRTSSSSSSASAAPGAENLTPEQLRRIEENKSRAALLRQVQAGDASVAHLALEAAHLHASWYKKLENDLKKPYFAKIKNHLEAEKKQGKAVYPPEQDIYSWSKYCPFENVKVVILGQDPYHNVNQAHGLAFSVRPGVAIPPSLLNMYKELEQSIPGFVKPSHGCLAGWARQGVLLLNASLTVRAHTPNSHSTIGWETFTNAAIETVSKSRSNVVFFLWGANAQKKTSLIDKNRHLILQAPHPSPLSASRGFFGCQHFLKCNEYLTSKGQVPIKWDDLEARL